MWLGGCTWPAAGAAGVRASWSSSPQLGVSRAPRRSGLCFLPGGLSFSLTQVTFQPFPVPCFAALPSDSADLGVGVGGQGGRECLPPSQGSWDS